MGKAVDSYWLPARRFERGARPSLGGASMEQVLTFRPLSLKGARAWAFECSFIAFAVAFPAACHAFGWNVFAILPMHWTVLLAGLSFGPMAGALAGVAVPLANFALTGMPAAPMLAPIVVECALYGTVPGLLSALPKRVSFLSVAAALLAGRLGFMATMAALGRVGAPLEFAAAAFAPGALSAALQAATIPLAGALIASRRREGTP
jgi:hypothetical protein